MGYRKEVSTVRTRVAHRQPDASSGKKRATNSELRESFSGRWVEKPHLSRLGAPCLQPSPWFADLGAVPVSISRIIYSLLCLLN